MSNQTIDILVEEENNGVRIDKFLSIQNIDLSRSHIQKLIKEEEVLVNSMPVQVSHKLVTGEVVTIKIPGPVEYNIEPEDLSLDIVYEDEDVIIINKGKGMVVHPAAGHFSGTIVNGLLYHCKGELSTINGELRPGIVHRIDMNTTGLIVACKNNKAHEFIAKQLKEHSITRRYNAIVYNSFKEEKGFIDASIARHPINRKKMAITTHGGKRAITHYKVLENLNNKYAHIECSLETGRTHQIRVHMASIHHPLLGDDVYGVQKNPFKLEGQALHARVLGFIHPTTREYIQFEAPLPEYFTKLLTKLRI